jgi:glutathionylspermidine synthase
MQRESIAVRPNWRERCAEVGFHYHTIDGTYWDESVCYAFTADEIDALEAATQELHRICLEACDAVVAQRRFAEFAIPPAFQELVAQSWRRADPSVFGRFDLAWTATGPAKLLEYNADTPTALLEASVVQWHWMQDVKDGCDQFNSIHEKLIERWKAIAPTLEDTTLYFTCVKDSAEDLGNIEYLRDTAIQAGIPTEQIFIEDLGWSAAHAHFVDLANAPVEALFKLYPWEWLAHDEFGRYLPQEPAQLFEPAWKMLLSNKAILAVLWELYPNHANLLPAYRDAARLTGDYVRKPILSREGANVALRRGAGAMVTPGTYGAEGFVYQAFTPLAVTAGQHAVIGSWIIGDAAAGIGIREDKGPITTNASRFVPHYFV